MSQTGFICGLNNPVSTGIGRITEASITYKKNISEYENGSLIALNKRSNTSTLSVVIPWRYYINLVEFFLNGILEVDTV